jgi:hypothetical protein
LIPQDSAVRLPAKSPALHSFESKTPSATVSVYEDRGAISSKEPNTKEMKFEDIVKAAEQAAVLVLVY